MTRTIISVLLILICLFSKAQDRINFTEKFKKENQGKYKIEINEAKELIHIMLAITKSGLENNDMIQQEGVYYKDVISYFKPFKDEKIIKTFDSLLVASPYNYIFLTGNGISYDFKGEKLVKNEIFVFPATGVSGIKITENPITTYKKEIEDFAVKSKFREFYKKQKPYYSQIISDYDRKANLGKQWKWLEKNFKTKINSYIIFCSPLINSLNYTGDFDNNNFKLIYMVLPPLDNFEKLSELQNELFNTRVMFTEIDHNYVKAPSIANKEAIDQYFKDRKIWTDENTEGIFAYPNPVKVFDEYMTYGVFVLFCEDNYDQKNFLETKQSIIALMKERGFPKMQEFTDKLLKVRAENRDKKIDDWYPEFLKQFAE
ncbi:DUF4932 domain-containing protein [Epilithonimonas arachidiradicis]|uniref:Uncharacterized protein DUF4932 n=1 Tax=Epilithonimonas arachidiradicis TaxID=1617282 RepID=A0A420CXA4_9FLAO|nr:DUF4932 domain-containing protein [Epilithonimonas arachidiradicis]RKE83068.1 uncharacterized protein DUF4932 [Epilithonimonas arachidiradicis]GGG64753.1 hypothetical protein GCM10007332_28960 [Epilithonimonas arachidiradicis]